MARKARLPAWFREEDVLRRILLRLKGGRGLYASLLDQGISRASWHRARMVANGHCMYPGEVTVAKAFFARVDKLLPALGKARPALFTEDEGKVLAKDMGRWTIPTERGERS